jgi:hypothetical protein
VIRYRTKLTESRTSELQRLGKVLQDTGIKIGAPSRPDVFVYGVNMTGEMLALAEANKVKADATNVKFSPSTD